MTNRAITIVLILASLATAQMTNNPIAVAPVSDANQITTGTLADARLTTITQNQVASVKTYGATGDGSTDDTAAIQAAWDAGVYHFPVGTYKVTSTVTMAGEHGRIISGAGNRETSMVWAGDPNQTMLLLKNCQTTSLRDIWIQGNATNPPLIMIESRIDTADYPGADWPADVSPNRLSFYNVEIGSNASNNGQTGLAFTAAGTDQNNDQALFMMTHVYNMSAVGFSFEHSQSLQHVFIQCSVNSTPVGLQLTSGASFRWYGGIMLGITDVCFDVASTSTGCLVDGLHCEGINRLWNAVTSVGSTHAIKNGYFAANSLNADGNLIVQNGGMLELTGNTFGGYDAKIAYIQMQQDGGGIAESTLTVTGNQWWTSLGTDPPVAHPFRSSAVRLVATNNTISGSATQSQILMADHKGLASAYEATPDDYPTHFEEGVKMSGAVYQSGAVTRNMTSSTQWIGGRYWTQRVTGSGTVYEIYSGSDAAIPFYIKNDDTTVLKELEVTNGFSADALMVAVVDVNAVEIKAMAATPIELVVAPAANVLAEMVQIQCILNYGSEVLVEPSGPENFQVIYDNGSGTRITSWPVTAFITATADCHLQKGPGSIGASTVATTAADVAKNIVLTNAGDEYTGNASNDTTMKIIFTYRLNKNLGL
ncbi:MAG: hypothetical protein HQ515_09440 [Phycisphaeraceae bacterium]|nr:hypothetical protein [Phycisphaeraceae bacterium]